MGRFLISPFTEDGFLFPGIGLAEELRDRGHYVAIIADVRGVARLKELGINCFDVYRAPNNACAVEEWGDQDAISLLLPTIRASISDSKPDAIIGTPLSIGTFVASEEAGIPAIVMGFASYLLPRSGSTAKTTVQKPHNLRSWRYAEKSKILDHARRRAGLGPPLDEYPENTKLNGALHLLRTVPKLEVGRGQLPKIVRFVGACLWEPASSDEMLMGIFDRKAVGGMPIIYAQVGRSFKGVSLWTKLIKAFADENVVVIAALARCDVLTKDVPDNFLVARSIYQGSILPKAQLVVCDGHSTAVLGALSHGVPSVLVPNGSGTEEIAFMCKHSGATAVIQVDGNCYASDLRKTAFASIADCNLRRACKEIQQQFGQYDGFRVAADEIEAWFC